MRRISTLYNTLLFTLEGDGEESDDFWRKYYKAGKEALYTVKMVFPDFNEEDLK